MAELLDQDLNEFKALESLFLLLLSVNLLYCSYHDLNGTDSSFEVRSLLRFWGRLKDIVEKELANVVKE